MVPPSSVEGGEVTEVSGGGVVGHSAGDNIRASGYDKGVTKIDEAGKTVNMIKCEHYQLLIKGII